MIETLNPGWAVVWGEPRRTFTAWEAADHVHCIETAL
jgi:hypothetical protein